MVKFISVCITAVMISTSAHADTPKCDGTDVAIGIAGGVAVATVAALSATAGLRLVGPGIAAGTKMGIARALSQPYLTKTTLPMVGWTNAIMAPIYGTAIFYGSCVLSAVE